MLAHIIGTPWSPRCHEVRDLFVRNDITTRFLDIASPEGQDLLTRLAVPADRDPVIVLPSGAALIDPTNLEIAHELGAATRPASARVDVVGRSASKTLVVPRQCHDSVAAAARGIVSPT